MRINRLSRREFITLIGDAAATRPLKAAQHPAMQVIGFLHPASPDMLVDRLRGFRQGRRDTAWRESFTWRSAARRGSATGKSDAVPQVVWDSAFEGGKNVPAILCDGSAAIGAWTSFWCLAQASGRCSAARSLTSQSLH